MNTENIKKEPIKKEHSKKKEISKKNNSYSFSFKTFILWSILIFTAICVGVYFSPLKKRIIAYLQDDQFENLSEKKLLSVSEKMFLKLPQKIEVRDEKKNDLPVKSFDNTNFDEYKSTFSVEITQMKQLVQQTSIYSFVINNLMFQLSESDPLEIPEEMINLLPTSLKYDINKIFLDADVNTGDVALSVFQLNDELQKNFVSWSNMGKDFNAKKYFNKFWMNVRSWVKVEKIETSSDPGSKKGKSVEQQLKEIQQNLMKYDFQNVQSLFKELPDVVQVDMKVWHDNLMMREKFFKLKKELNQIMLNFFKGDIKEAQNNMVLEFDVQPENRKSE